MPRGGVRPGAGRKPRQRPADVVPFAQRPPEDRALATPPADLTEPERAAWVRFAARAIEQGTLTAQTVPALRLLCELDAEQRALKETLDRDGRTYLKVTIDGAGQEHQELRAHPLTTAYHRVAKQVENLMARFKLAPMGKAEAGALKRPATANPWAVVAGKGTG